MNKNVQLQSVLKRIGLSHDESIVFLHLLKQESTHLAVSRATRINRTKVYRIVQDLEQRGFIMRQSDDRGTFLKACDPGALELELLAKEQQIRNQRSDLHDALPLFRSLSGHSTSTMTVKSYEGVEGFKQMCWHELKAQGELLVIGGGTIQDLIPNQYWAEKHRALTVEAGYTIRELVNNPVQATFTNNQAFMDHYSCRTITPTILPIENQTVIYNNTVSLYQWQHEQCVGLEIISTSYASMMRAIFEQFWKQAQ